MISFVIDVTQWFPNEKEEEEVYDDEENSEMNTTKRRIPEFVSAIITILKRFAVLCSFLTPSNFWSYFFDVVSTNKAFGRTRHKNVALHISLFLYCFLALRYLLVSLFILIQSDI